MGYSIRRRVVELSTTLPSLRKTDEDWIRDNYNKVWHNEGLCYYVILERCKEFQVIRYYYKSVRSQFEFMQIWMDENGNDVTIARTRYWRVDGWDKDSEMKVKRISPNDRYRYLGDMRDLHYSAFRVRSMIPALKRNGFRTSMHGLSRPYHLCKALLTMPRIETLWKTRQYTLVNYFYWCNTMTEENWQSIRVALKHGYNWENYREVQDWLDMLYDLRSLNLDTRNPHYICPANLQDAHQHWNAARMKKDARENEENRRKQALKDMEKVLAYEPTFFKNRERFMDMEFVDGEIHVAIIPTAAGIKEEGIKMHHCVGGYYNKVNSLILSAKINGERIETIEVNLRSYELVQSRGICNQSTEYHKRIVDLVNSNMDEIRRRNVQLKMAM